MKNWGILSQVFRHNIMTHGEDFRCVSMLNMEADDNYITITILFI